MTTRGRKMIINKFIIDYKRKQHAFLNSYDGDTTLPRKIFINSKMLLICIVIFTREYFFSKQLFAKREKSHFSDKCPADMSGGSVGESFI